MTKDSPLPETVRLVARVLAVRPTPQQEIPGLISAIHETVAGLGGGAAPQADPVPEAPGDEKAPMRRRPGRPRKVFAPVEDAPALPAAAPRLMRRADMATAPAADTLARPVAKAALRGIVKWFDPRARIGALRLPGHDDVAIDGDALERAGIARLYKGQEIEASVTFDPGAASPRLVAVMLPGRPEPETPLGSLAGAPRRHAKPVVIEMKRDAMRRVAARVEAEHLLGTPRRAG
jgi:cold shock CspA family protein